MMSFAIINEEVAMRGELVADRELYTDDAHTLLLEAGDSRAGMLLAIGEGARIPVEYVTQLDLVSVDGRIQVRDAAPKERAPSADKQLKTPAKNKSAAVKG